MLLPLVHATRNRPSASVTMSGTDLVAVLAGSPTRNSGPEVLPSALTMRALTTLKAGSSGLLLVSVQATTKRPSSKAVMALKDWEFAVMVLIRNSVPNRVGVVMAESLSQDEAGADGLCQCSVDEESATPSIRCHYCCSLSCPRFNLERGGDRCKYPASRRHRFFLKSSPQRSICAST